MIRISSKREGFRRCGIAHTVEPVEYPDDRWSADELRRLQGEPMLTVDVIVAPPTAITTDRDTIPKRTYTRRTP